MELDEEESSRMAMDFWKGWKVRCLQGWNVIKRRKIQKISIEFEYGILYNNICLLYTSDAADEEDSVDLGGPRLIKKKKKQ